MVAPTSKPTSSPRKLGGHHGTRPCKGVHHQLLLALRAHDPGFRSDPAPHAQWCCPVVPRGTSPIIDNKKPCIKKFNLGDTPRQGELQTVPSQHLHCHALDPLDPLGIWQGEEIDADHHGNQGPRPSTTWEELRPELVKSGESLKCSLRHPKSDQGILQGRRWSRESSALTVTENTVRLKQTTLNSYLLGVQIGKTQSWTGPDMS